MGYRKFKGMLIRILYQDGKWSWICKQGIPLWKRIFLCAERQTLCTAYTQEASLWTVRRWRRKVGLQNEKINKFVNRERERERKSDEGKGPPTGKSRVLCEQKIILTAFDRIQIYGFDSQTLSRKMKMIKSIFFILLLLIKYANNSKENGNRIYLHLHDKNRRKKTFQGTLQCFTSERRRKKLLRSSCEMRFQKGICIKGISHYIILHTEFE